MRPHRLELEAFGPFPSRIEIDIDELAESGLVLLHGDTGAGKTSVLDAIGYALYGDVPGMRGVKRLRSDHASAAAQTWVRLEFSAGGRRLRVTRWPAQEIAKQRGAGTRKQPARVLLEQRHGDMWQQACERPDEAGMFLRDAIGLTSEQFFQVVLLPQNGFAEFLHAPADKRQAVLEQLFGTQRFAQVEDMLTAQRNGLLEQCRRGDEQIRFQLAGVARTIAEIDPDTEIPALVDFSWAKAQLVTLDAQSVTAKAAWDDARSSEQAARVFATEQQRLFERQQRLRAAGQRLSGLTAQSAVVTELRSRRDSARQAAGLAVTLRRLDSEQQAAVSARAARAVAESQLDDLPSELLPTADRPATSAAEDPAGWESALRSAEGFARAAVPLLDELAAATAAVAALGTERTAVESAAAVAQQTRLSAEQQVEILASRLVADQSLAAQAVDAAAALDVLTKRCEAAELLPAARKALAAAERVHLASREELLAAGERALAIREARLAGYAAELAAALVAGEPCQVCGAAEHPAPAAASDAVGADQEQVAAAAVEKAQAAADTAATGLAAAQNRVTQLFDHAGSGKLAVLRKAADEALVRATETAAAGARLASLEAELVAATTRRDAARDAEQRAAATKTGVGSALAVAQEKLRQLQERVNEVGGIELRDRLVLIEQALTQMATVIAAQRRAIEAERSLQDLLEVATESAEEAGFSDLDLARAALLLPAELAEVEAELTRYDEELAAAQAVLADPELAVPLEPAAEPALALDRLALAERATQELHARSVDLSRRLTDAGNAVLAAGTAEAAAQPLRARAALMDGLADVVAGGGSNRLRMSLSAFVLAARLEQVAERASVRLAAMTSGRFSLHHTDEVGDARRKHGLGLAICDVWTGATRPTSSLSGGETFMTSLALALGLADVAAEEAGGRRIDALFIDEGFGSLDGDALDRVMEVLDGLREGGRLVGIVSHVGELRRRVPAQLHVVRTPTGSLLNSVVPTA
jgi:exonuclease SbcC